MRATNRPSAVASKTGNSLARDRSLLITLIVMLAVVGLLLAFAYLSGEVLEGETRGIDMRALLAAQTLRSHHPWVAEIMRDFSGLGSMVVLTLFVAAVAGYLWLLRQCTFAVLVVLSALSGNLLVSGMKVLFDRARPDASFAAFVVPSLSFPSGHASMSALVFLTVASLLASATGGLPIRLYLLGVAAAMTVLVGASRVVLGVHWLTDVLGGWVFGTAWAIAWLLLATELKRRGRLSSGRVHSSG